MVWMQSLSFTCSRRCRTFGCRARLLSRSRASSWKKIWIINNLGTFRRSYYSWPERFKSFLNSTAALAYLRFYSSLYLNICWKDLLDEYLDCLPAASTFEAHLVKGFPETLHLKYKRYKTALSPKMEIELYQIFKVFKDASYSASKKIQIKKIKAPLLQNTHFCRTEGKLQAFW